LLHKPSEFDHEHTLESDVVVVGAGAIGIATALELAESGINVALIDSGLTRKNKFAQSLAQFDSSQNDYFNCTSEFGVRRQVGGTTALWGGRCVPYDPIDFEDREFIPESGRWPIGYDDVTPYMQRACDWVNCGRPIFNAKELPELSGDSLVPSLPDADVISTSLERWSLPTRFGRKYAKDLKRSPNVHVWTGLTCTEVVTAADGKSVDHLEVKSHDGRVGRVVARDYIIATGGLEATRLLLASDRHHPGGLGNQGGHLGRWYMSHVEARVAAIRFHTDKVIFEHERDSDGVYVRRRFTVSPAAQRAKELPNAAVWLVNAPISDPNHGSGILSGVYLTLISPVGRFLLADAIRAAHTKTYGKPEIRAHLLNIVKDFPNSLKFAFTFTYARFLRRGRKAPGFFVKSADNCYPLHFHGEHIPDWNSWVELTSERDALGMRKIRTHTSFTEYDYSKVREVIELIDEHLRTHGVGHVEWLTDDVEASVREYLGGTAGYHQVGTTRMSHSPDDGVVDANLRVHGTENLYVASTSVLPTSSQANPTLTGIALGMRLAEQLVRARTHDVSTFSARSTG
jgi:choline dehydrogenase-like flavoprotein